MALYANNSVYAQALLLIGEAIVGFIFLFALIALVVLLCTGRACQRRWPVRCTDPLRGVILLVLLGIMLVFSMLVWAILAGFDQIPAYGAALLSATSGAAIILVGNLLHTRQSAGDYSYSNASPSRCGCCVGGGSGGSAGDGQMYNNSNITNINNFGSSGGADVTKSSPSTSVYPSSAANLDAHQYGLGGSGSDGFSKGGQQQRPLGDYEMGLMGGGGGSSAQQQQQQYPSKGGGGNGGSSSSASSSSSCCDTNRFSNVTVTFFKDLFGAVANHRERWLLLTIVACFYILVSGVCITVLQGICWCSNPKSLTTWVSRRSDTRFCHDDQFCHLYPLLGVNSTRMRLVGHIVTANGDAPRDTSAKVCPITLVGQTHTAADPCSEPEWVVRGKIYDHSHLSEDRRFISRTSLVDLKPMTHYRATVSFTLSSGAVTSRTLLFRTGPAADDVNATVRFISGGDMHSSASGRDGLREALTLEPQPDFILIGGDISYSNNMRYCYLRVDTSIDIIISLRTSMGASIPLVFLIGNHESGGYGVDSFDKFYFHQEYFANFDDDADPSRMDVTTHRHLLSGSVGLVCLDSDGIASIPSQNQYLRDSLSWVYGGWRPPADGGAPSNGVLPPNDARVALVTYHNPAYPSLRKFTNGQSARVRENWCPLMDRYKVPLALEFHDHAFKRSWPIRGNAVQPAGAGTVYIGDGGLGLDRDVDKDDGEDSYLEKKLLQHNVQLVVIGSDKIIHVRSFGDNYELLDDVRIARLTS